MCTARHWALTCQANIHLEQDLKNCHITSMCAQVIKVVSIDHTQMWIHRFSDWERTLFSKVGLIMGIVESLKRPFLFERVRQVTVQKDVINRLPRFCGRAFQYDHFNISNGITIERWQTCQNFRTEVFLLFLKKYKRQCLPAVSQICF